MEEEQETSWANSCLFCTATCTPKFRIGTQGKLLRETDEGSGSHLDEANDGKIPVDQEEITVEFIVGNILNLPQSKWKDQLSLEQKQGFINLLAVCKPCQKTLENCLMWNNQIDALMTLLNNGRNQLKTQIFMSGPAADSDKHAFWNFVRKEAISEFLQDVDTLTAPVIASAHSNSSVVRVVSNSNSLVEKGRSPSPPVTPLPESPPLQPGPPQPPSPITPSSDNQLKAKADEVQGRDVEIKVLKVPAKPPPDIITLDDSDDDEDNWKIKVNNQFDVTKSKLQQNTVFVGGDSSVKNPQTSADNNKSTRVLNDENARSPKSCKSNNPPVKTTPAPQGVKPSNLGSSPAEQIPLPNKRKLTSKELARFSLHFAESIRDSLVYKCSKCSAFFTTPLAYKIHVETHKTNGNSKEVIEDCDKCGWWVRAALKRAHMDYVHAPTSKTPSSQAACVERPENVMAVKPFQIRPRISEKRQLSQPDTQRPQRVSRPQTVRTMPLDDPALMKILLLDPSLKPTPLASADPRQNVFNRSAPLASADPRQNVFNPSAPSMPSIPQPFGFPPSIPISHTFTPPPPFVTQVPPALVSTFADDPRLAKGRIAAPLPVPAPVPSPVPAPSTGRWVPAEEYAQNVERQPFKVHRVVESDVRGFPPHVAERFLGKFVYKCNICPRFYLSRGDFNSSGHAAQHYKKDGINCRCCGWVLNKFESHSHEEEYHELPKQKQPPPIYLNW